MYEIVMEHSNSRIILEQMTLHVCCIILTQLVKFLQIELVQSR